MEDPIQKLIQSAGKVSLSSQEKSDLKNQILIQMNQPIQSPYVGHLGVFEKTKIIFGSFRPAYGVALLLIFVLGGGMSVAAEDALPGNFLYPIKVKVNEKISGVFVVGSLNKAERESQLIDRRLEEVKILSKSGELSEENIKIVEDQIRIHAENSKGHIVALEAEKDFEGALNVQVKLKSSLAVNEKIVIGVGKNNKNIALVVAQAQEELAKVSDKKDFLEEAVIKESGFDLATMSEIKKKTAKLAFQDALESSKKEASEIVSESADSMSFSVGIQSAKFSSAPVSDPLLNRSRVDFVAEKIQEGEVYAEIGEHDKAIKSFEEAYQLARDIILVPEEILGRGEEVEVEIIDAKDENFDVTAEENVSREVKVKEFEKEKIKEKFKLKTENE